MRGQLHRNYLRFVALGSGSGWHSGMGYAKALQSEVVACHDTRKQTMLFTDSVV